MAIKYTESTGEDSKPNAILAIDNGDLQALKEVMETYNFIDQQALLRYALVSLLSSEDNTLYIREDGNIVAMKIADLLVKKADKT
ncbi:MAG: hypothetical protein KIH65_001170 [Candidatus Uhrbacteria bacterium]|nr:hypothetical protein [Candidatus Uhrbacteria bacterium]